MKVKTHDLIAVSLYNDLIVTLEEIRKRKDDDFFSKDYKDLIEGYTLAREMIEHFFSCGFISEPRYYSLDEYLHYCTDCPVTHCIPLQVLQLGITLT